ncbi:hypothetical protein PYV00_08140 [Novosphingobium sp. H3SJ31-1]|uniref:Uncharacterized protein n=1 Tax=Novosphingobium album (ex Liu et al. 2023) TaxID=3031130 RepID=A0ABT5WP85_9SPHN|nr:hypothetical protein [Novosphingobium album (ex Liu et al. 2023)]
MLDYFALALSHGLLALACWRLLWRDDLDQEPGREQREQEAGRDRQPAAGQRPGLRQEPGGDA